MRFNFKELNALRIRALEGQDAEKYFILCNELSITDIEDPKLYEHGQLDSSFSKSSENLVENSKNLVESYDISKVVVVALSRFYEKEVGERISGKEIRNKLSLIRETGYFVKPYSQMRLPQLWDYLTSLRHDISLEARKFCPSVLEGIISENNQKRNDAQVCR